MGNTKYSSLSYIFIWFWVFWFLNFVSQQNRQTGRQIFQWGIFLHHMRSFKSIFLVQIVCVTYFLLRVFNPSAQRHDSVDSDILCFNISYYIHTGRGTVLSKVSVMRVRETFVCEDGDTQRQQHEEVTASTSTDTNNGHKHTHHT